MSISLTGFNLDTLTFSVCANQQVAWSCVKLDAYTNTYIANTTRPYVSGLSTSETCSAYAFNWNTLDFCSSALSLTAKNDIATVALCAYLPATPTTSGIYTFNPQHLYIEQTRINDNTLSATAYYQQVSTFNLTPINGNYDLTWYTTPYTINLSSMLPSITTFDNKLNGTANSVSSILLSSNIVGTNTFQFNLSSPNALSLYNSTILINGIIGTTPIETNTSYIKLSTVQYEIPLQPNKQVIWEIDPYTMGVERLSGNGISALMFNTQYSALCAGYVTISTTDLTESYTYALSSYTGRSYGTFRPYQNLASNTTLSASVSVLSENTKEHQYLLDVHGITNNVMHNLDISEFLVWNNTSNDLGIFAKKLDNSTNYVFSAIDTVNNIEKINLHLIPNTTTEYPRLCTYSFSVCALSGNISSEAITHHDFNIQIQEWLDSSIFTPAFTIQYEPSALNTIYRPLTSASYRITNDSILPENSVGNLIYKFDDGDITVPYDTITGTAPSGIYHTFNASTPCVCTVNMTVETSCANYSSFVTRDAITKSIVFTNFPVGSNFIMYPEFEWTGTTWGTVVSQDGTILSTNAPLSAYSFCHTENFFVSSSDLLANQYVWSVQNSEDNTVQTITTVVSPTGWLPVKSPADTTTHSVCAALYTTDLPSNMPVMYFDTPIGQRYPNFSTTFENPTTHRKHINFYGVYGAGLKPYIIGIEKNPMGSPSNLYLTGGYTFDTGTNDTPFNYYMGAFSFILSSNYFEIEKTASLLGDSAITQVYINADDIGDGYLSLPKYDVNNIDLIPIIGITPRLKTAHPSAVESTWCFSNTQVSSYENRESVTIYPVLPLIYTPNRYVLTGVNVRFENLANCFSGIENFVWDDRGNSVTLDTCMAYTTSFNSVGIQDITLTTNFSGGNGMIELTNDFKNVVNVDQSYNNYDSNINRVYGITQLVLPHDYEDVSIGANDWLVADTFNASMTKLYNNLEYLQYMAQLYDVPPTEYFGWLGTRTYSNSSEHFRWYVNSPNITYGYNSPDAAINGIFTALKDVYVRDNIMYVSNGTTVSVLSSDFRGTLLGTIDHKTIGDNFTNIKAVKLDSDNRIYLLDTIDTDNILNGSKNRIIVFDFNFDTNTWQLLHSWGGLGGPNAHTKFNNPNDMYIDSLNNVWVSDTGVIKQFTRTGSWLQTITSDLFTDNTPLSLVLDSYNNLHVLTSSKIIKFSNTGVYLSTTNLNYSGAKTIRPCSDAGFAYITYTDKIVKYMFTDGTQASFANGEFVNYTENYQNVFHDEFRNVYAVAPNHILKYVDKLFIIKLNQDIDGKMWPLEKLFVDKNEFIQDWVVNKCLNRMYDNLEIFKKSLNGKFSYRTIENTTTVTTLSTILPPSDFDYCNYDWLYNNGIYVDNVVIYSYEKPDVRTFTTDEYLNFPYTKDDIYIGINEFVAAPTLNRPLKQLYDCQLTLLEMIS